MKMLVVAAALLLSAGLAASPAEAGNYNVHYADLAKTVVVDAFITTTDTLTEGTQGDFGYLITSISGTRNGVEISGLLPTDAFGQFELDNRLYPDLPALGSSFVNNDGIGFGLVGSGEIYNLFGAYTFIPGNTTSTPTYYEFGLTGSGAPIFGPQVNATLTTAEAAVPEPATWSLMIFGFGMASFLMRRRTAKFVLPAPAF